ncbi:hypothetical protein D3C85_341620 [compost metagenome]
MELLHAYSLERLALMSEPQANGAAFRTVKGTVLRWTGNGVNNGVADSLGIRKRQNLDTYHVDFSDAIDPARLESYWVTVGWLVAADRGSTDATITANELGLGDLLTTPKDIFKVTNGQPVYVEAAYNPITLEGRWYASGVLVKSGQVAPMSRKVVRMTLASSQGGVYTIKDIYVGRFAGNEEPRLRRWKSVTLPPVTNGHSSNVSIADGDTSTVGGTKIDSTYTIPAGTMGVVAQCTMLSVDNLADLTATVTDGTLTSTVRTSDMDNQLVQTDPSKGHSVFIGSLTPTPGATVLTVGVKAVDRA